MFTVRLSKFGDLYTVYDSRVEGNAVTFGSIVPGISTQTLALETPINISFLYGSIIFLTGNNAGFGSEIILEFWDGSAYEYFIINDPFDLEISNTDEFLLIKSANPTLSNPVTIPDSIVSDINFGANVEVGFSGASVDLEGASIPEWLYGYMGHDIKIYDDHNDLCWQGIIQSVSIGGSRGRIEAVGYRNTFEHDSFYNYYEAADANVSSVTIFTDIISQNVFLDFSATKLDRGNVIHNSQKGTLPTYNFTEAPTSCADAISEVLKMGATPLTLDPMYLQVWEDRIPVLSIVSRNPATANWIIRSDNVDDDETAFVVEASLDTMRNVVYGAYTDESGLSLTTKKTYDVESYLKYGPRTEIVNGSNLGLAEMTLSQSVLLKDKSRQASPQRLTIKGTVSVAGSSLKKPVWKIRPGNVVSLASDGNTSLQTRNRFNSGELFVVGETNYSCSTGTLDLWFYESPDLIQSYIDSIDIGV